VIAVLLMAPVSFGEPPLHQLGHRPTSKVSVEVGAEEGVSLCSALPASYRLTAVQLVCVRAICL
jgi:hypothetical protein